MRIAQGLRDEAMASPALDLEADARMAAVPLELKALAEDVVLVGADGAPRFSFRRMAVAHFFGPADTTAMLAAARALERAALA